MKRPKRQSANDSNQENNNMTTQQRKLQYRQLLNQIEEVQEQGLSAGLNRLLTVNDIIKQANDLQIGDVNELTKHPEETILDSVVLSASSGILKKCCESVNAFNQTYEPVNFAERILENIEGSRNFERLLPKALEILPDVPGYKYVYGTYERGQIIPEPKQRKKPVRQPKNQEQSQKKQPEKITEVSKEEESIETIVKFLYKVLKDEYFKNGERPVKYYDYIIDTNSFANTVENMFYLSFLIRDGKAHIDLDDQLDPVIRPVTKNELKRAKEENATTSQMIASIAIDKWETFQTPGMLQKHKDK